MATKDWKKTVNDSDIIEYFNDSDYENEKEDSETIQIMRGSNKEWSWNVRFFTNGVYAGRGKFFKSKSEAIKFAKKYMEAH